ncbi:hypothetical protein BDN72DRAFT_904535 [Pluteus cervinus]|uniref:Uncharacterized protein n=1 Tax=Pluteus cervinus TaxID=181527 RepID=A0ACD3A5Z5_9AGAR|nr:hypothetical protein BDN72DRAFT_904535 [Pluteus cervinus]
MTNDDLLVLSNGSFKRIFEHGGEFCRVGSHDFESHPTSPSTHIVTSDVGFMFLPVIGDRHAQNDDSKVKGMTMTCYAGSRPSPGKMTTQKRRATTSTCQASDAATTTTDLMVVFFFQFRLVTQPTSGGSQALHTHLSNHYHTTCPFQRHVQLHVQQPLQTGWEVLLTIWSTTYHPQPLVVCGAGIQDM